MMKLHIADELKLPLDAVTQAIALLAKRRVGKSYTARRFAEQLIKAGQQVVIMDPKGDWWGIRSSANGKSAGLPIVMLGGERGDVPLEANSGEMVARLVVEERISCLIDLSLFRKHEVVTFSTAFLENLYRLKNLEKYRTPLMLFLDEGDVIAPQKPQKGEERMLGAAEDIVRRGGQRGLGCTLITQRSAVLNKNVLTQVQMLVTLRTIAPQDLKAMNEWIDVHGTPEQRKTLMESLPSLPVGEAWFWSPGWPTDEGIFKRVKVLPIETYDSGATPKPGEKRKEPKKLADIDLDAIRKQMAEVIEKAKDNNPKLLRARITELEKELKKKEQQPAKVEVAKLDEKALKREIGKIRIEMQKQTKAYASDISKTVKLFLKETVEAVSSKAVEMKIPDFKCLPTEELMAAMDIDKHYQPTSTLRTPPPQGGSGVQALSKHTQNILDSIPATPRADGTGGLQGGERPIMIAIASNPNGVDRKQLMILTGYKATSVNTYVQRVCAKNYALFEAGKIKATPAGIQELGDDYKQLPSPGKELIDYWRKKLTGGEQVVFEALYNAHPESLTRNDLMERCNYKATSVNTYVQRLSARKLIEFSGKNISLSRELFE